MEKDLMSNLPMELALCILQKFEPDELLVGCKVSSNWGHIFSHPRIWWRLCMEAWYQPESRPTVFPSKARKMDYKRKFIELTPTPSFNNKIINYKPELKFEREPIPQPTIPEPNVTVTFTTTTSERSYYKENKKSHAVFKAKGAKKREGIRRKCAEMAVYEGLEGYS